MPVCCSRGESADDGAPTIREGASTSARLRGRTLSFVEWTLPVTALALIPKCPACLAGYILLFTGIGLSVSAAAAVRWTIIIVCVAVLAVLLVRFLAGMPRRGSLRPLHRR